MHTTLLHTLIGKGNQKTTKGKGKAGCHLAALALNKKYRMFVGLAAMGINKRVRNAGPAGQVGS